LNLNVKPLTIRNHVNRKSKCRALYGRRKYTSISSLTTLENTLNSKFKNLSPEERVRFGSVHEQNKLFVNKVNDFRHSQAGLSSPDVDWEAFQEDVASREYLQSMIARLESLTQSLKNNKILHDYDCYHMALTDYDYTKYKVGTKQAGYEVKIKELSQFFTRSKSIPTPIKPEEPTE
jgi:hypothetical protein